MRYVPCTIAAWASPFQECLGPAGLLLLRQKAARQEKPIMVLQYGMRSLCNCRQGITFPRVSRSCWLAFARSKGRKAGGTHQKHTITSSMRYVPCAITPRALPVSECLRPAGLLGQRAARQAGPTRSTQSQTVWDKFAMQLQPGHHLSKCV